MSTDIICKTIYGSNLYGTNIPTSDTDEKGVYLPTKEDCFLGTIKDTVNIDGVDGTLFSIQKFMRLAAEGQSVAIEMLFTPKNKWINDSPIWEELVKNRHKFLTKKMKAFMGFSKSMAMKYSVRADKLNDIIELEKVLYVMMKNTSLGQLFGCDPLDVKLSLIWDKLPEGVNFKKSTNQFNKSSDNRVYVVCGKEFQAHITISQLNQHLSIIEDEFGDRVRKAQSNTVDWKSIMHSFRVTYQCRQAVLEKEITFPCNEVQFLRDLRAEKYDMNKDNLGVKLDELIKETDALIINSDLPDEVDWDWCEKFILDCYSK